MSHFNYGREQQYEDSRTMAESTTNKNSRKYMRENL